MRGITYIVDDHGHGRHVDTTGQNVGRDEDLGFAVAELVDDRVALGAFDTASQGRDGVAFGGHTAFNLCRRLTGLDGVGKYKAQGLMKRLTLTKMTDEPMVRRP